MNTNQIAVYASLGNPSLLRLQHRPHIFTIILYVYLNVLNLVRNNTLGVNHLSWLRLGLSVGIWSRV